MDVLAVLHQDVQYVALGLVIGRDAFIAIDRVLAGIVGRHRRSPTTAEMLDQTAELGGTELKVEARIKEIVRRWRR